MEHPLFFRRLGKNMAEEGWAPKLPIVLVPGFGSTGLEVIQGYEKWKGERVWLSISKIGGQALSLRYVSSILTKNKSIITIITIPKFLCRRRVQQHNEAKKLAVMRGRSASSLAVSAEATAAAAEDDSSLTPDDIAFKVPTCLLQKLVWGY
jgi:hypothetical protein